MATHAAWSQRLGQVRESFSGCGEAWSLHGVLSSRCCHVAGDGAPVSCLRPAQTGEHPPGFAGSRGPRNTVDGARRALVLIFVSD